MHCAWKKYSAALFFSLLMAVPLLLIASLQSWQAILKQQWKERLEQEAAQTITLPLAAVVWEDEGAELIISGKLFDLFSYHVEGDSLTATGVFDEQETKLKTFLATQYSHSPQSLSIVQLLFVLQCFAAFLNWSLSANTGVQLPSFFSTFSNTHTNPFSSISTPPPRSFFYERL